MAAELVHEVKFVIAGETIADWLTYDIKNSLVHPADSFTFTLPMSQLLWRRLKVTDRPIKVTIDDTPVLDGYTGSPKRSTSNREITIGGYDKVARLVSESAPAVNFHGLTASQLIAQLAAPWFSKVSLRNTRNRDIARGRKGHKVRTTDKAFIDQRKGAGTKIEPGQFRWTAIANIARQMDAMCWSSVDGQELIIGQPNTSQEVQFVFTPENSLDIIEGYSTDDRYSHYLILGAGAGTDANYGHAVSARYGEAKDNASTKDGTGRDFSAPKHLIIADRTDLSSRKNAKREAELERTRRDMKRHLVQVEAPKHGQIVTAGSGRTLFACDCIAAVRDDEAELNARYLIVDLSYKGSREAGESTSLELMLAGQKLVA